jgi:hypothetical protein
MAGTATISTIKHDVTGAATTFRDGSGNEIGRLNRGWVTFVGSTAAVRGSFNISTLVRDQTGVYTASFSTAMPDGNYAVGGSVTTFTGGYLSSVVLLTSAAPGASSCQFGTENSISGGTFYDANIALASFNR